MEKHPIGELMEVTMQKMREMVDANTVVGQAITTADGITIIPISKISYGFASGGSDFQAKHQGAANPFGGGAGAGVKVDPVAFMVIRDGSVRLLNVAPPVTTTVDRIVETAPEVVDRISDLIQKNKEKKEEKETQV